MKSVLVELTEFNWQMDTIIVAQGAAPERGVPLSQFNSSCQSNRGIERQIACKDCSFYKNGFCQSLKLSHGPVANVGDVGQMGQYELLVL